MRTGAFAGIHRCWTALLAAALCMVTPQHVLADSGDLKDHAASFTFENDLFFNTDRYYTDGVQLTIRSRVDERADLTKRLLDTFCQGAGCSKDDFRSSQIRFGQLMYTPRQITVSRPQPLDRPWAGLLYLASDYNYLSPDASTLTTLTGEVGVTGPASHVEQTQKWVHRTFTGQPPRGWSNQVPGELGLLVSVQRKHALGGFVADTNGLQGRVDGHWRVALGNIMTYGAAGLTARFGKGLPKVGDEAGDVIKDKKVTAAPPVGLDNALMGAGPAGDDSCIVSWLRCSAFATVEVRLMARNIFLDGPLFRSGPHVTPRRLVADMALGARLDFPETRNAWTGPWYVQFKATRRTPEFKSPAPVASQRFGALTVGTDF